MRVVDIIAKKRDKQPLSDSEIQWFVENYTSGTIPDYQAASLLMAIYLNGMEKHETVALTMAMAQSGDLLDLSGITDYTIDKHSSGGVGDKTSLVVLPLVASFDVPIAKMSGRGLGHSGGTLDKIETFPGYNVNLDEETFLRLARETGLVLAGQTRDLAPADGKLYALRDVTGTVASLPLIASSIMSKKIAAGANGIVLDVKAGNGAFMHDVESARELAQMMVDIGVSIGRDMVAVISDMNQPLGHAVGNAIETIEAIETLRGGGPKDFREHCVEIAHLMLKLAGRGTRWTERETVRDEIINHLDDGRALSRFRKMIEAQGGDPTYVDDLSKMPKASIIHEIVAEETGYIQQVRADAIASAALALGAGREKKDQKIDLAVGVIVNVKVGNKINKGEHVAVIHANHEEKLKEAIQFVKQAITYSNKPVDTLPLFYDTIYGQ
ncbi:MAG: thymidine phosphorylase [Aggregatilineales bacterium]